MSATKPCGDGLTTSGFVTSSCPPASSAFVALTSKQLSPPSSPSPRPADGPARDCRTKGGWRVKGTLPEVAQGGSAHGSRSSYAMGCRCAACRAANTEYSANYRRRKGVPTRSEFFASLIKRSIAERLEDKIVRRVDGCWEWVAGKTGGGYGFIHIDGRPKLAHRVMYELHVGPIPQALQIDHLCRNRACVNPDHLDPVSSAENTRRGLAARGPITHCKRGHEFTPENTGRHSKTGARVCRKCHNLRWHKETLS